MNLSHRAALCALLLLVPWGLLHAQPAPPPAAASAVVGKPSMGLHFVPAQVQSWPQTLSAVGNVQPWQEVVVGAEVGGLRLAHLAVEAGDRVKKGQLLARLHPGTLEADLAASRASLLEAEASAQDARRQAERVRSLQGSEALSVQAVDQALAAEAIGQARLAAARARVQADELRLAYTQVLAPDDGVVSSRTAVPGALVQVGQELFRVQRQGRLEWRAEVPGAELARLRAGQRVRLQPSGASALDGRVRRVAPTVETGTRNGLVYVDLPAAADLRAGLFARGDFVLAQSDALTVPQAAVLLRDGFSYVFKREGSNKVRQHKVRTGRRQGERVEVLEGLAAGEAVAASGVGFLADGDTVRVLDSVPAAKPATAQR